MSNQTKAIGVYMQAKTYSTIDEYIASFPDSTQKILQDLRQHIAKAAPEASEAISYGIPTFKQKGNVVHFAAYKTHIGLYPAPGGIAAFEKEIAPFHTGKGTLQFPLDKPLPMDLISKIVKYRVEQNQAKK